MILKLVNTEKEGTVSWNWLCSRTYFHAIYAQALLSFSKRRDTSLQRAGKNSQDDFRTDPRFREYKLTPCSKLYLYSRSRGYKTFSYSYWYSSGVQIGDFSCKVHSLLRTILKAVSAQNAIYNEICWEKLNKCLNSTSLRAS